MKVISIENTQFKFERRYDDEAILVIASRSHHETKIDIPEEYQNANMIFNLKGCNKETLAPYGVIALKI